MNKIPSAAQNKLAGTTMSAQAFIGNPMLNDDDRSALRRVKASLGEVVSKGDPTLAYVTSHHRLAELDGHIKALEKAMQTVPANDRRDFATRIELLDHTRTSLKLSLDSLKKFAPDTIEPEKVEEPAEPKAEPKAEKKVEKKVEKKAKEAEEEEPDVSEDGEDS